MNDETTEITMELVPAAETALAQLTNGPTESMTLEQLETYLDKAKVVNQLIAFVEGAAFKHIHDGQKYLQIDGITSFEQYCQERRGINRQYAYRLMAAYRIAECCDVSRLATLIETPLTESTVRPLAVLENDADKKAAMDLAVEDAPVNPVTGKKKLTPSMMTAAMRKLGLIKEPKKASEYTPEELIAMAKAKTAAQIAKIKANKRLNKVKPSNGRNKPDYDRTNEEQLLGFLKEHIQQRVTDTQVDKQLVFALLHEWLEAELLPTTDIADSTEGEVAE